MRMPLVLACIVAIIIQFMAAEALPVPAKPVQGWQDQLLKAHNAVRKQYHVPPLTWSSQLAKYAQQWAETLLQQNGLQHRTDSPYGENLATAMGQRFTPEQVVAMWVAESGDYNHARNTCAPGKVCGHFTQVIWKDTKQVGCGVARNDEREVWVCNYNPPGNIVGRKPY